MTTDENKADIEMYVENVALTVSYYNEYLGGALVNTKKRGNNLQFAWVKLLNSTIVFKSNKQNINTPFNLYNIALDRNTYNIKDIYLKLKNKMWIFSDFKKTENNKFEFAVTDCNGTVLRFFETN